jgi:hypothetical protein
VQIAHQRTTDNFRPLGENVKDGLGCIFRVVEIPGQPQASAQNHRMVSVDHLGERIGRASIAVTAQQFFVRHRLQAGRPGAASAGFPLVTPIESWFDHPAVLPSLLKEEEAADVAFMSGIQKSPVQAARP